MRQGNPAFGQAHEVDGVLGGNGDLQGLGIGVADIFGGKDNHPAGDEERILTGFDHAHQPVKRGVGIAASKTLNKRGNNVVVCFTGFVILQRLLLQGFLDMIQVDFCFVIFSRQSCRGFQRVQCDAAISLRLLNQEIPRFARDFQL